MQLVEPSAKYGESFMQAMREFEKFDIRGFWNFEKPITTVEEYIEHAKANSEGKQLPKQWVPSSTFWLIDNGVFVAHVNIRHSLNDFLKKVGGHIGFFVRPSMHGKGYGSSILRLALPKARALGIERALVTCDETNIASKKVIEKNGGVSHKKIDVDGKPVLQFWIEL